MKVVLDFGSGKSPEQVQVTMPAVPRKGDHVFWPDPDSRYVVLQVQFRFRMTGSTGEQGPPGDWSIRLILGNA